MEQELQFTFECDPTTDLDTTTELSHEVNNEELDEHSDEYLEESESSSSNRELKVRLDKWLWAARFFKTRALARVAVENGKVFYNNQKAKPSREIQVGATLQIKQGRLDKIVIIKGLSTRRRSAEEASSLFEEVHSSENTLEIPHHQQPNAAYRAQPHRHHSYRGSPERRQKKVVRFLRRAFVRGEGTDGNALTGTESDYRRKDT